MSNAGAALAVTLVSALQICGCSSSSKSLTSIDPGKTITNLTPDERRQFCEDRYHYLSTHVSGDDRTKINCAVAASLVGSGAPTTPQTRAACQQAYQACIAVPAAAPQSACDAFARNADGCTATVGEASDCAEAQVDALEKLSSSADSTCDDLGKTASKKKDETTRSPAACSRPQLLCPKLFDEPALSGGKP